jgi:hypothetical protein
LERSAGAGSLTKTSSLCIATQPTASSARSGLKIPILFAATPTWPSFFDQEGRYAECEKLYRTTIDVPETGFGEVSDRRSGWIDG